MLPKRVSVCVRVKLWLGGKGKSEALYKSFHIQFGFHIRLVFQPLQQAAAYEDMLK